MRRHGKVDIHQEKQREMRRGFRGLEVIRVDNLANEGFHRRKQSWLAGGLTGVVWKV